MREREVEAITVWNGNEGLVEVGAYEPEHYRIGVRGVTRIEAYEEPGMYCGIPYLRVWTGDLAVAEFCKHNIIGVYYKAA